MKMNRTIAMMLALILGLMTGLPGLAGAESFFSGIAEEIAQLWSHAKSEVPDNLSVEATSEQGESSKRVPTAEDGHIWRFGDTGEKVTEIQARLKELGYLEGNPTGTFDEATEEALMKFQKRNRLLATGMADENTLAVLFSENAAESAEMVAERNRLFMATATAMPSGSMDVTEEYEEDGAWDMSFFAASSSAWEAEEAWNTNEYSFFAENGFQLTVQSPLSTFAADVDTASYAQLRSLILQGKNVPADAVRVEEMLNYFHYDYASPEGDHPFGVTMELAKCPWNANSLLLQLGLQAKTISAEDRPAQNLVFLIDVSGSMFGSDRLDLVKRAFLMLLEELNPTDTVSLVTYASRDEVVLEGVPAADKVRIMEAISGLEASGSTNSAAGIQTAYQIAEKYAREGSSNRILMATDGDFNVGMTSEGELARLVMEKKENGVRLTMLGVGYGNYKDNKLEALADYGDGNYYYLDTIYEARRALVTEAGGTMVEVAKDVKLQMDFNPAKVAAWRLIGYEDRVMAAQDFADDTRDGGEIGSGHRVMALYEIVPVGNEAELNIPVSRYAQTGVKENAESAEGISEDGTKAESDDASADWCTLAIRYKAPGEEVSTLEEYPFRKDAAETLSDNMKWAAAVTECAMLLRDSEFKGDAAWDTALSLARDCGSVSGDPYKEEFVYLLTLLQRQAD